MKKTELIDLIQSIFDNQVKTALKNAGIGDFTIKPSTKMNKEDLDATLAWLDTFIKTDVAQFVATYNLCPPQQWQNYKMLGLTDLPEILLLKDAKEQITKTWKSRPTTIWRTYCSEN